MIVAAAGPNRIAAAKTDDSETDSRAGMVGMRIVNDPLRRVKSGEDKPLISNRLSRDRVAVSSGRRARPLRPRRSHKVGPFHLAWWL